MTRSTLTVAPCSHEAAKHAVMNWHYSHRMPNGKLVKLGVWEDDRFIGCVIFGRGATPVLLAPYGLEQHEGCELVRVALADHEHPVSAVVSQSLRKVRSMNPGLRLVVSFADQGQGHHGGIYQATNWVYTGTDGGATYIRVNGEVHHPRSLGSRYGPGGQSVKWLRANIDPAAEKVPQPPKHRYLMPLDRAMRRQIAPLSQPYPQRS